MTNIREFITPVQRGRLPSFVRSDYPAFEKYIVDYFEFLEEDGNSLQVLEEWRDNGDPDNNVSPYVDAILLDLGWTWTGSLTVSKRLLLKNLREFYLSRGTFRSFEFLFRTLFDETVQIRYPREEMLYLDQADYASEITLYSTAHNRLDPAFAAILEDSDDGKAVEIVGQISGVVATVESIRTLLSGDEGYLQITILQPLKDFVPREGVMLYSESGYVVESSFPVLNLKVLTPGSGYAAGDDIDVEGAGLDGLVRVSSTLAGGVDSITITDGGLGYTVGDKIVAEKSEIDMGFGFFGSVSTVDGSGTITGAVVLNRGKEYKTLPKIRVNSVTGAGADLSVTSTDIGGIKNLQTYQPYVDFDTLTVTGGNATFTPTEASTFTANRYKDRRGVLGENAVLIDSDRYQQFSYDLLTAVPKRQHRSVVDDLLHPVGYVRTDVLRFDASQYIEATDDVVMNVSKGVQDTHLSSKSGNPIATIAGNFIQIRTR